MLLIAALLAQANPFDRFDTKAPPFAGSAKMILFSAEGVVVAEYASQARCESARLALANLVMRENEGHPPIQLPNGGTIVTIPLNVRTLCIPG